MLRIATKLLRVSATQIFSEILKSSLSFGQTSRSMVSLALSSAIASGTSQLTRPLTENCAQITSMRTHHLIRPRDKGIELTYSHHWEHPAAQASSTACVRFLNLAQRGHTPPSGRSCQRLRPSKPMACHRWAWVTLEPRHYEQLMVS